MSKAYEREVTCPRCRRSQEMTIWASVNATVDPPLRGRLLNHDLNVFRCSCGHEGELAHDLLYHDMTIGFLIWLKYPDEEGSITLEDTALGFARDVMKGYTFRIVRTRDQLIEKILIFEDGLDDRVMEVLKLVILSRVGDEAVIQKTALYYSGKNIEASEHELEFVILNESGEERPCVVGYDEGYGQVADKLGDRVPQQMQQNRDWQIVDREFALRLATKMYS